MQTRKFGYICKGRSGSLSSVLGRGVGIGVEMGVVTGGDVAGSDVHRRQAPSASIHPDSRPAVGLEKGNASGPRPDNEGIDIRLDLPNPHRGQDSGKAVFRSFVMNIVDRFLIVVLMPSDGLFDMERFSLLSAPSSSSRSSPALLAGPNSAVARRVQQMECVSSGPAPPGGGPELRPSGSEEDVGSLYSNSAPARE